MKQGFGLPGLSLVEVSSVSGARGFETGGGGKGCVPSTAGALLPLVSCSSSSSSCSLASSPSASSPSPSSSSPPTSSSSYSEGSSDSTFSLAGGLCLRNEEAEGLPIQAEGEAAGARSTVVSADHLQLKGEA